MDIRLQGTLTTMSDGKEVKQDVNIFVGTLGKISENESKTTWPDLRQQFQTTLDKNRVDGKIFHLELHPVQGDDNEPHTPILTLASEDY